LNCVLLKIFLQWTDTFAFASTQLHLEWLRSRSWIWILLALKGLLLWGVYISIRLE
jgi:hypothetical protein